MTAERFDYFYGGTKQTVRLDGSFEAGGFGPDDGLVSSDYVAQVLMPISDVQPLSVQAIIGPDSENLKGPLIGSSAFGRVVKAEGRFSVP